MNVTIYYITSNHTYFLLVSKSVRNGESFTFYGRGCYITFPERERCFLRQLFVQYCICLWHLYEHGEKNIGRAPPAFSWYGRL